MSGARRAFPPLLACLSISLAAAACGGGEAGRAGGIEPAADTIDGVLTLHYPETPGPALAWRLDTLHVLGGVEATAEAFQFDGVAAGGLAGTEDGRLYVLDGMGKRVIGFDPAGRPVEVRGREGSGPGELNRPSGLAVGPGDTLWVLDGGNRRVTLFPPDTASRPVDLPLPEPASGLAGQIAVAPGGLWGVSTLFFFRPGDETGPPPRVLLHLSRAGEVVDSLWSAPPIVFDQVTLTVGGNTMMLMSSRRFTPGFWWQRFPDGRFAVVDSSEYDVRILAPDGTETLRILRAPAARPVTEADREAARQQLRDQQERSTDPFIRQSTEQRIEKMTFADVVPRITGLAVDGKGRLWVGVSEDVADETQRIDVYEPDGSLVGEIRDPPFLPALFYGGDRAAVLDRDEMDVQRVVVTRLVEGAAAGD